MLLGLDLETDVQFPLVVPSRTNKQIQHLHSLLFFFLQFYSFYLFIFYSEYKTKPLQKVNKIITLKKHYKTKSFHIKFRCMLLRLEPQKLPINIETFTMPSTRAKEKQNCICVLTNIKMSFLDMTQDATYQMRCKRGRLL